MSILNFINHELEKLFDVLIIIVIDNLLHGLAFGEIVLFSARICFHIIATSQLQSFLFGQPFLPLECFDALPNVGTSAAT